MNARTIIEAESPKQYIQRVAKARASILVPAKVYTIPTGQRFRTGNVIWTKVRFNSGELPSGESYAFGLESVGYPVDWDLEQQQRYVWTLL
jgi:hypothetical protein